MPTESPGTTIRPHTVPQTGTLRKPGTPVPWERKGSMNRPVEKRSYPVVHICRAGVGSAVGDSGLRSKNVCVIFATTLQWGFQHARLFQQLPHSTMHRTLLLSKPFGRLLYVPSRKVSRVSLEYILGSALFQRLDVRREPCLAQHSSPLHVVVLVLHTRVIEACLQTPPLCEGPEQRFYG